MSWLNFYLVLFGLSTSLLLDVRALESEGIVGGDDVEDGEYTYQVSIQVYGQSVCGGGIVDDQFVITAAHCVINERGNFMGYPMKVMAGINDLNTQYWNPNMVAVDVARVYVPSEYDPTRKDVRRYGDIAVLKLLRPLGLARNTNLSKLRLADPRKTYAGDKAVITGFGWNWVNTTVDPFSGYIEETGGGRYGKMRYAEANVISQSECQRNYANSIYQTHICAKVVQRDPKGEGVCSGDSGGPLVYNGDTLIGVVSTSPNGCTEQVAAAVYTRVSSYLGFIFKAVKDMRDASIRVQNLRIAA